MDLKVGDKVNVDNITGEITKLFGKDNSVVCIDDQYYYPSSLVQRVEFNKSYSPYMLKIFEWETKGIDFKEIMLQYQYFKDEHLEYLESKKD